uniref:BTB domain-containing protein n=1 Tax=Ascaris lumbricoides TaxID=6252 RepID=A0A0M3IIG0_ASCLU
MSAEPSLQADIFPSIINLVPTRSQTSYTALPCNRELLFSVVVDNHCRIRGERLDTPAGAIKFPIDLIDLIVHPQVDQMGNTVVILYGEARYSPTEWVYTTQLRIKTGTGNRKEAIRLVDKGFFQIGKWLPPITIRVIDPLVKRIKLEFKFINQQFEYLPRFENGDVTLRFKDGSTLCVDKALLALHSRYMASFVHDAAQGATIDMGDFEMEAFRELLYQIYATRRPIETDLPKIAKAANAFKADIILSKLTAHIFALDMGFVQKMQFALFLELDQTLSELVYVAEQRGELTARITPQIREECTRWGITVPQLIDVMLRHIYPSRAIIPGRYFRPMMMFAEEHSLRRLLNSLGEMMLMEPPLTPQMMLDHLQLAHRYQHGNLFRACLLRIEGSFKTRVSQLMALPQFNDLPEAMRKEIVDRHCSGWALKDQHLAGLPTCRTIREVTLTKGGPPRSLLDKDDRFDSPDEMRSIEAFGSAHDMKMTY